jgi:putative ABC transport system ATP-binding protein
MPDRDDLRNVWGPGAQRDDGGGVAATPAPGAVESARAAGGAPLLEGIDVVRSYPGAQGVLAVRGASLSLASQDFVALMGPSGSGKTTFIGTLSGLDAPDEGEVRFKGEPITAMSRAERIALRQTGMGVVFQSFGLLPTLSAVENVELPLRVNGVDLGEARERALGWLERLGLTDRVDNRTFELSAGQQQRVAVARALVSKPAVVFADEPTGNLDSKSSDEVLCMLRQSVDDLGQSVVMVTHDPEAASHADRLIVLRDGQIVHDGSAGSADDVIELMKAVA